MEKLQPVLKQHYWICFGLSLIFVLVGWWMASGSIAAETKTRQDSVKASMDAATQGETKPNATSVEGAKKRNDVDTAAYDEGSKTLWQRQQKARQWPEALAAEMKGIAYQAMIDNKKGTRTKWARNYDNEIKKLLEIVKPFKDGEGLVVVDASRITRRNSAAWKTGPPASAVIWDAQEDMWLLKSLLTSIAAVNEGATRITESNVREIYRLHLRGGDRAFKPPAAGGGGGMGGSGGAAGGLSDDMYSGMAGAMGGISGDPGGGAAGGGATGDFPGKSFMGNAGNDILGEEFGANAGAGGMGNPGAGGSSEMMGMGAMGGGMGAGATAAPKEEVRYVDNVDKHYKTRGFLLDVLVRDDKLADLLASLTNSDFPVEIVRVEIASGKGSAVSGGMVGGDSMSMMGGPGMSGRGFSSGMGGPPGMSGGMGMGAAMGGNDGAMLGSSSSEAIGVGGMGGPPGMGAGMGRGMGMMGGGNFGAQKDDGGLNSAMNDPLLLTVKIGGLMTLYQSAEEKIAQEATEAAAATEQATTPPIDASGSSDQTAVTPDGTATDPAAASTDGTSTTAEGTSVATDAAASTDAAVSGAATPPADGTATDAPAAEGEPGTSTDTAPAEQLAGEKPTESDPAGTTGTDRASGGTDGPANGEAPAETEQPADPAGETGEPAGESPKQP